MRQRNGKRKPWSDRRKATTIRRLMNDLPDVKIAWTGFKFTATALGETSGSLRCDSALTSEPRGPSLFSEQKELKKRTKILHYLLFQLFCGELFTYNTNNFRPYIPDKSSLFTVNCLIVKSYLFDASH